MTVGGWAAWAAPRWQTLGPYDAESASRSYPYIAYKVFTIAYIIMW